MDVNFIMDFIANQGFAIGVAIFVLVRNDQTIQKNTEALNSLRMVVENQNREE